MELVDSEGLLDLVILVTVTVLALELSSTHQLVVFSFEVNSGNKKR